MVTIDEDDYIAHYGVPRRSGRYPWGTTGWGEGSDEDTSYQRNKSFLDYIRTLFRRGLSEKQVADAVGLESVTQLRAQRTIARAENKAADIAMAQRLQERGWSNVKAAERMGIPEATYRSLLKPGALDKVKVLTATSNVLKADVDQGKFIDVGQGVEQHLGVSREKLNAAVSILKEKGYEVHPVNIPQVGTQHETRMKVLCPPGTTQRDLFLRRHEIQQSSAFSVDGGRNFTPDYKPLPVDPKRVGINYAETGGDQADGVIYVREGLEDLSLGHNRYAQVRIQVGDNHYLKGMAIYKEDMPPGVDLLFNTNKKDSGNKFDAMKELTDDPKLPFGSVTRPILKNEGTENERVSSAMNIVNEEGKWDEWSNSLSTQFLSKQRPPLIKERLDTTYARREKELNEIKSLTNPTVKKKLLEGFADDTDSSAVHLEAAAMPRQNWRVILPVNSMSENEVYAPHYKDGERVVLIRYPHGGIFEIPELTVNNRNPEARRLLGNDPTAAIGINHKVAQRLSGADFDGDAVLIIPNNNKKIKNSRALEQLKDFDPVASYPAYPGMKPMTKKQLQQEMGKVSNLITDMTIRQASNEEIARAVKHSMVVIDAEKKNLNYKQSALDNNIKQLKKQYQDGGGAHTLISRATAETRIPDRKPRPMSEGGPVDRRTGERVWVPTGKTRRTKDGGRTQRMLKVDRLAVERDAHNLSSGTPVERLYANHSNKLKNLASSARLEALNTPPLKRNPSAARVYKEEVASLRSKLALSDRTRPIERQAQIVANTLTKARIDANPGLPRETIQKISYQELEKARRRLGAERYKIDITPREWDAIQAGAISNNHLTQILRRTDTDKVRKLATPRPERLMTTAKRQRAMSMLSSGATRAEIAEALGVSLTTLDVAMRGD